MNTEVMTSNKPYLIRALHTWICDNDCTPYLYINTQVESLQLPEHLLADNPLILNASPNACRALSLENDSISFQARFSGQVVDVYLPIASVLAIVARENGQGMTFELIDELSEYTEEEPKKEPKVSATTAKKSDKEAEKNSTKKTGLKVIR